MDEVSADVDVEADPERVPGEAAEIRVKGGFAADELYGFDADLGGVVHEVFPVVGRHASPSGVWAAFAVAMGALELAELGDLQF